MDHVGVVRDQPVIKAKWVRDCSPRGGAVREFRSASARIFAGDRTVAYLYVSHTAVIFIPLSVRHPSVHAAILLSGVYSLCK